MKTTKILDNPLEADFFVSANISAQEQLLQTEQKTTISSRSSSTVINREDGLTDAKKKRLPIHQLPKKTIHQEDQTL